VCLNCGLALDTNYCPDCGQHNTSHNHGLGQFIQEFLEEFIRFDSKLIRTILPLVTKPGFLTQEWIAGKRIRYITPLKLYISLSAICFLAISIGSRYNGGKGSANWINFSSTKETTAPNSIQIKPNVSPSRSAVGNYLNQKFSNLDERNQKALSERFISLLPTVNLMLMPVAAFILQLLFFRRKRFYVEHLVFTLHFYSFAFLVIGISSLIPFKILGPVGFLWIMGYFPFAMVKNYGQRWLKTLLKVSLFWAIYTVVVILAILATLVFSAPDKPDMLTSPSLSNTK
jgi:hypothetical protein